MFVKKTIITITEYEAKGVQCNFKGYENDKLVQEKSGNFSEQEMKANFSEQEMKTITKFFGFLSGQKYNENIKPNEHNTNRSN